jgi:hypothetical protein
MEEQKKEQKSEEQLDDRELITKSIDGELSKEEEEAGEQPAPKEPTPKEPEKKEEPKKEKSLAEIEAEIDDFLRSTKKTEPPKPKGDITQVIKSSDGKTVQELLEEGRQAEAIELTATIVSKRERESAMREISENNARIEFERKRTEANRKVYIEHPELIDIDKGLVEQKSSPFAVAISQVYREYPNLLEQADGPVLAMEIAEKRTGFKKVVADKAQQSGAQQEAQRQDASRAAAVIASSSSGARPPAPEVGDFKLSDEQKLIADRMGLSDSDYGRMVKRQPVFNKSYYDKYRNGPRRRG